MGQRGSDAGGRAGSGGFDYQARVGAPFATRVLAGAGAPPADQLWHGPLRRIDLDQLPTSPTYKDAVAASAARR